MIPVDTHVSRRLKAGERVRNSTQGALLLADLTNPVARMTTGVEDR